MNLLKWMGLFAFSLTLVACGTSPKQTSGNAASEKIIDEASVVLTATKESLFMETTTWKVTEKTVFRTHSGAKITAEDIQPGDLVSYENEGPILESYPMQGTLKEVVLFDDAYSMRVSAAITSFLANQPEGNLLIFELTSLADKTVTAEMKKWDFEDDRTFIVEIDLETHTFDISEKAAQ